MAIPIGPIVKFIIINIAIPIIIDMINKPKNDRVDKK